MITQLMTQTRCWIDTDMDTDRHVYGQTGKKEFNIENVKVSNQAWDTNLISASGVSFEFRFLSPSLAQLTPLSNTSPSTGQLQAVVLSQSSLSLPLGVSHRTTYLTSSPISFPLPAATLLPSSTPPGVPSTILW